MKDKIALFQGQEIRKTFHNEEWWFVVEDVVAVLTDSVNVKDYINKMRLRDAELSKGYGQIVHTLDVLTKGGKQKMNCANTEGIFRIIQSIPSPKAEPFKLWLAKVGYERIKEIEDPELATKRTRELYKAKDYAILTAEISKATFDMTPSEYKDFKGIKRENLRDHMNGLELIFSMLGEASTTEIARNKNAQGFPENKTAAQKGGKIAGDARKHLELESGKKVSTSQNYLEEPQGKKHLR